MGISVSPWLSPAVAAACIAASPVIAPPVSHAPTLIQHQTQTQEVLLTSEVAPADLLSALESLGADELPGEALGLFGLDYVAASLIGVFNTVLSLILTPISWVPIVGSWATSLIWLPVNLVEQMIMLVFGGVYYPYYAEATDPGLPAELAGVAEFNLPDTAPTIDVLGLDIDALGLDGTWNLDDLGDAVQDLGAALLGLFG